MSLYLMPGTRNETRTVRKLPPPRGPMSSQRAAPAMPRRPTQSHITLIAADVPALALKAVRHLIESKDVRSIGIVHLLNVQPEPSEADTSDKVTLQTLWTMRDATGNEVLREAGALLSRKGIPYSLVVLCGSPQDVIVNYVKDHKIDDVILGSRRLYAFRSLVGRSVADDVSRLTKAAVKIL
jgi:nucleotide-binding universal stress UspA family protein